VGAKERGETWAKLSAGEMEMLFAKLGDTPLSLSNRRSVNERYTQVTLKPAPAGRESLFEPLTEEALGAPHAGRDSRYQYNSHSVKQ
jgi:hypothetical protein